MQKGAMETIEIDQVDRPAKRHGQIFNQANAGLSCEHPYSGYGKIEVTRESGGFFGHRAKKDRQGHSVVASENLLEFLLDIGGVSSDCVSHDQSLWMSLIMIRMMVQGHDGKIRLRLSGEEC